MWTETGIPFVATEFFEALQAIAHNLKPPDKVE